jgi:hypothetical protein
MMTTLNIIGVICLCILLLGLTLYVAALCFLWAMEALDKADALRRARSFKKGVFLLPLIALIAGCSTPVPKTAVAFEMGGQKFNYVNPKQAVVSNLVFEVQGTNGIVLKASIGSISSVNDPAVVDKAYAGQALVIKETFNGVNTFLQNAAALGAKTAAP